MTNVKNNFFLTGLLVLAVGSETKIPGDSLLRGLARGLVIGKTARPERRSRHRRPGEECRIFKERSAFHASNLQKKQMYDKDAFGNVSSVSYLRTIVAVRDSGRVRNPLVAGTLSLALTFMHWT